MFGLQESSASRFDWNGKGPRLGMAATKRARPSRRPAASGAMATPATLASNDRVRALEHLLSASMEMIQQLQQDLARTRTEAERDALTGLANRRGFDAGLRDALCSAAAPVSLLILDIDHFKRFNDTHGHPLGDAVLRMVARTIQDQVRTCDLAARHGGEEFAVVLPGASLSVGMAVAEQIRELLEHRAITDRGTGKTVDGVTCSIGVAEYRPGETADTMIDRCDRALYRAKRGGRNKVAAETFELIDS